MTASAARSCCSWRWRRLAERSGRDPDDPQVRLFAGAMVGVALSAMMTWAGDPEADFYTVMDGALSYLEAGLPL